MGNTCRADSSPPASPPKIVASEPVSPVLLQPTPAPIYALEPDIPKEAVRKFKEVHFPGNSTAAQQIVKEFKRFFQLASVSPSLPNKDNYEALLRDELVPSPMVDRMWRVLITSDGRSYSEMCNRYLGALWHRSSKAKLQNYKRTISLYKSHFGALPSRRVWPLFTDSEEMEQSREGFLYIRHSRFSQFYSKIYSKAEKGVETYREYCYSQIALLRQETRLRCSTIDAILKMLLTPDTVRQRPTQSTLQTLFQQAEESWLQTRECRQRSASMTVRSRRFLDSVTLDDVISEEVSTVGQQSGRPRFRSAVKPKPENRQIPSCSALDISVDSDMIDYTQEEEPLERPTQMQTTLVDSDDDDDLSFEVIGCTVDNFIEEAQDGDRKDYFLIGKDSQVQKYQSAMSLVSLPRVVLKNFRNQVNVSNELADLVVLEYERFLILRKLMKDDKAVPSRLVMLLWEFHSIETRSYSHYCRAVFHKDLSIKDTASTKQEMVGYLRTLEVYEQLFRCEPSQEVWPPLRERFTPEDPYRCVNLRLMCAGVRKRAKGGGTEERMND